MESGLVTGDARLLGWESARCSAFSGLHFAVCIVPAKRPAMTCHSASGGSGEREV